MDPTGPFALLWDRDAAVARLFEAPRGVIETNDTPAGLAAAVEAARAGDWLAGGLAYEAGHGLEPRLGALRPGRLWLGRFGAPIRLDRNGLAARLEGFTRPAAFGTPEPLVARADWLAAVSEAQTLIASGDIYQANLSFPCRLPLAGHPLALFARLFDPRSAPEGGLVHDGAGRWWLSFSPELLFAVGDGRIEARPMKGTAARGPSLAADRDAAAALAADPKNRAENLMITDLVRHDLARVAVPGSVRVPALLAVETYPTVHQMTSTVTARLAPGRDALDVLRALFPAGSITGAPKIRAAEVIAALEPLSRDIYCGSIGWVAPGAAAARFNVAIRTIAIEGGAARLGLGAGIVADSDPQAEWAECLVKARFLERSGPAALLETMRREADGTIPRLARHLDRLQASAARFGFRFDRAAIDAGIAGLPRRAGRLRLLIAPSGAVALQLGPLPDLPAAPASLALAPLPLAPDDWRLVHKTTDRGFYARARAAAGTFEVAFHMPDGRVTEGSFTSLFVERDGRLATPPATLPLLPGVLRDELLAGGAAVEAELGMADLAEASAAGRLFLGNSLRGLFPARLVTP